MTRITTDEIQSRVAAYLDQNPDTSDISTDVYSLRLKYINMGLLEWQEVYDWQVLYKEYNTQTSTSTGNASIALPSDFRKPASFPVITHDGATSDKFAETRPQEAGQYGSTDKRVEYLGNYTDGYTMRVYGVNLASGASIKVPYFASAGSLATTTSIAPVPNPDYLVKRTIAYWLETREDPRFTEVKSEAERILQNMIERENVFSESSTFDRVKTVEQTRYNFRIGRD